MIKSIILNKKFLHRTFIYSVFLLFLYILLLILFQYFISGKLPLEIGFLNRPKYSDEFAIIWLSSRYYMEGFEFTNVIIINSFTFILLLIFVFTSSINLALTSLNKKTLCNSALGLAGVTFVTQSIVACPACSINFVMWFSQVIVFTLSGTTLGLSAIFINLMNVILFLSIFINIILFIINYKNIKNNKLNLNINLYKNK